MIFARAVSEVNPPIGQRTSLETFSEGYLLTRGCPFYGLIRMVTSMPPQPAWFGRASETMEMSDF